MIYVYLAGPIAGCNKGEAHDWRKYVCDNLLPGIKGIDPLRCEAFPGRKYRDAKAFKDLRRLAEGAFIEGKNWLDVNRCDMILAVMPKELNERRPSYGTTLELGWGMKADIPIVLVTDDPQLANHPLITRNIPWIYEDIDEGIRTVNMLLEIYTASPTGSRAPALDKT